MTQIHQQLLDEIPNLSPEKANQVFTFVQFVKYQFNNDTLEAIAEVEEMKKNPSAYKSYSSFSEILAEVEDELANEI